MTAFLVRFAIGAVVVYALACVALFALQERFLFPAPQEPHAPAPGFEAVTLTTADGLELAAHWHPPIDGKPSMVWFHGNAGSLAGATDETALLTRSGYGVLLVSYRGYGGNPGSPSEDGFYRDGEAAMQFLSRAGVAPEQTIIAGNSIGSGTAVEMAQRYEPAALILVSPFTALSDVAAGAMPYMPVKALISHRFDNRGKLPSVSAPVLVLHGTADRVVPFAHGEALVKTAKSGTFVPFEGVGHDLSFQLKAQREEADWLAELGL